jgi:hypothetical protein
VVAAQRCAEVSWEQWRSPVLRDRGAFFLFRQAIATKCTTCDAEDDMNYLLEHPNSMPVHEAAMTYLFEPVPVLSLVCPPELSTIETEKEGQDILKSA